MLLLSDQDAERCSKYRTVGRGVTTLLLRHSPHAPQVRKGVPMTVRSRPRRVRKALLLAATAVVLTAGDLVSLPGISQAAGPLPCDIYGSAGTPCVAAHSTTR